MHWEYSTSIYTGSGVMATLSLQFPVCVLVLWFCSYNVSTARKSSLSLHIVWFYLSNVWLCQWTCITDGCLARHLTCRSSFFRPCRLHLLPRALRRDLCAREEHRAARGPASRRHQPLRAHHALLRPGHRHRALPVTSSPAPLQHTHTHTHI